MIYYILALVFYFISGLCELYNQCKKKNNCIYTIIMLLPLFILTAFRDINIGADTYSYYRTYNLISQCPDLKNALISSRMEKGFILINYLVSKNDSSYLGFQIVITLVIYISLFFLINKYSVNVGFSLFAFLSLRMAFGPMNTIRMWAAIAIILFANRYLINRQLLKFSILIIMASLFHTSALIYFVMYFVYDKKIEKKNVVVIVITSLGIGIVGRPFFAILTDMIGKYSGYLDSEYFTSENNIAVYLNLLIDVCFALFLYCSFANSSDVLLEEGKSSNVALSTSFFRLLSYATILLIATDLIGIGNTIMSRVASYFQIYQILIIPLSIYFIKGKKRTIYYFMVCALLVLQFMIVMVYRPQWNFVTPYKFWSN